MLSKTQTGCCHNTPLTSFPLNPTYPTNPANAPRYNSTAPMTMTMTAPSIITDGPEINTSTPISTIGICHKLNAKSPDTSAANIVPMAPPASPMAAKIPANLAMSKAGAAPSVAFVQPLCRPCAE